MPLLPKCHSMEEECPSEEESTVGELSDGNFDGNLDEDGNGEGELTLANGSLMSGPVRKYKFHGCVRYRALS